jgi:tetratricopeptide (TPR) repeat protein
MTRALLIVVLAIAVAPRLAAAQPIPPSSEQLAKDHYERGAKLFAEKNYIAALGEFAAGYELVKRPMFLFNMGECARLLGDRDDARSYYQRYLATEPTGKYATLAQQRLDLLAAEAAAANQPAAPAAPAAPAPAAPAAPARAPAPAGPRDSSRPPWMPPTPSLIAGGAGVVLLALSGAFSLRATGKWSDAKEHCDAKLVCDRDGVTLADQATTAADGATVTLVLGLVAIAGGGGYWLYDRYRTRRAAETPRVVPTATGTTAGVALVGRF